MAGARYHFNELFRTNLNAQASFYSQQRHSALWRRKSRDQRNLSLHKEDEPEAERDSQGDEGEEDFEEEDTDEDEEEEEEEEIPDIVGIDKVMSLRLHYT